MKLQFLFLLFTQLSVFAQHALITSNDMEKENFKKRAVAEPDATAWMKYTRVGETDKKHCPGVKVKDGVAMVLEDTEFARAGRHSVKCVLDRSAGGVCHKAMIRNSLYKPGLYDDERWISFSVYLPGAGAEEWKLDWQPELLFQVHNDIIAPPMLSLNCHLDTLSVNYRFAANDPHKKNGRSMQVAQCAWQGPLVKGKWVDWIFHFRFSPSTPKGFLEVWVNNKKVVNQHDIVMGYPCNQLTTCDIGIYKWPWKCPMVGELKRRAVYIDEVRIGGPGATIGDMKMPDTAVQSVIRKVANKVMSNTSFRLVNNKAESRYNKWEYANGVLMIGMLQAAQALNDTTYANYAIKNFDFIFSNLHLFEKRYPADPKTEWAAHFRMGSLDDCGAMAAALTDVLSLADKKAYRAYLDRAADYIINKQMKLKDGTLSRPVPREMTIWADDLYMSVPFLARMGRLTGNRKYFDEAVKQVMQFNKYLYDSSTGLYFHCWYSDVQQNGVAHWLRCNGWVTMAQVELLNCLPQDHPQRKKLIDLLLQQIIGFSRYQDKTGLWHQVMDKPDSYLETSGTAMFVYTVARAVNQQWIDASYISIAKDGWKGLTTKITEDGQVEDVCIGTGIGNNIAFYYNRPKVLNEFHALGAVLLAGAEMTKLK